MEATKEVRFHRLVKVFVQGTRRRHSGEDMALVDTLLGEFVWCEARGKRKRVILVYTAMS